jgi:uncharacterized OsmC-like protein
LKITLLSDESIRLEPATGQLTIEAESADREFSPYQMLASGLAVCTFGVMQSWASNAGVSADDLVIDVSWSFAENPHRVGAMELTYQWPSLPPERARVAQRVAELCPLHKTLMQSPSMTIRAAA